MNLADEFKIKLERMKSYLGKSGADGVVLTRSDNFAWATCGGRSHVNVAQEAGIASFIFDGSRATVLTNAIEYLRLKEEELKDVPVDVIWRPWEEDRSDFALDELIRGRKFLTDSPFGGLPALGADFMEIMFQLTPTEIIRYRTLGARAGKALQETCMALKPGMSETSIAGMLSENCFSKGIEPIVILVATDRRIELNRHPLPLEDKKLEKTALLVLCARRKGLIASCSRMVSIGEPSKELREKHGSCVFVDVVMNMRTTPGMPIRDIFEFAKEAYWESGYNHEWENHHQGGPTGYRTRYFLATGKSEGIVKPDMAFAWNPSITGTKSEDTLLVFDERNEFITQAPDWPEIKVEGEDFEIGRPDILVL